MPSTSTWATEAGVNDLMVIIHVQDIWRGLSYGGREALLAPHLPAHGNTIRGLERKGLWADGAPTELGRLVVKFKPAPAVNPITATPEKN